MGKVILNPDYYMKNDLKRIILYSKEIVHCGGSPNWVSRIHPLQAAIFSFFTHDEPYEKCINNISTALHLSVDRVEAMIKPYINNDFIYTEWEGTKIIFPKNILIPSSNLPDEISRSSIDVKEMFCKEVDLETERYYKGPHLLTLMLNNRCMTKCKYCYADTSKKIEELTTEEIFSIIDNARSIGVCNINLIGGEVFLKREWNRILAKLVSLDMSPSYLSTKMPVTEVIVESLKATGYNNVIQVSLDSVDSQTLVSLINTPYDYFEKLKKGLLILQEYGFKIQINTILTSLNCTTDQIDKLYDVVKSISNLVYWEIRVPNIPVFHHTNFNNIKPKVQALQTVYEYIRRNIIPQAKIEIRLSDELLKEKFRSEKCTGNSFGGGACGALYSSLFILPDGNVTLCEELYWHPQFIIGNVKESSLTEIWNSSKAEFFLDKRKLAENLSSTCASCSHLASCIQVHKRCWTKILRTYGTSNWNYPDPRCERAPRQSELYCLKD